METVSIVDGVVHPTYADAVLHLVRGGFVPPVDGMPFYHKLHVDKSGRLIAPVELCQIVEMDTGYFVRKVRP